MNDTPTTVLDQLHALLEIVQRHQPGQQGEPLARRLGSYLGRPASEMAVLTEEILSYRFVDYDIALELIAARDPEAEVIGVGGGDMRHHTSLADLLNMQFMHAPVAQPDLSVLADSPTTERTCLGFGIRLFRYRDHPIAVVQRDANPMRGRDSASFEVLGAEREIGLALLAELRDLAIAHSVLRGQVIELKHSGFERSNRGFTFVARPQVAASEVILPGHTLDRIRGHVLGIAEHADALRRHGQHLKRGVLLYGPPGTGKTHTVRHLIGQTSRHTVILLSGTSLELVGLASEIARALQPAIVVMEDVDLVAEQRDFHHGGNPLLFQVMDAMDGLDGDADVTFLLTTNRVDAMETALTQRPGRVDLAAEIPLPDQAGRLALLHLYAPAGVFSEDALAQAAARLDRTTASLIKELVRRSVLLATAAGQEPTDTHLAEATERLLADGEELSRALLGAGREPGFEAGFRAF